MNKHFLLLLKNKYIDKSRNKQTQPYLLCRALVELYQTEVTAE